MAELSFEGMLTEHQAPATGNNDTGIGTYNPTPEERKAIQYANRIYERNKANRKKFDQKWVDYYKMFRGKQWNTLRPSYRHSEVVNFVFQTIQSQVPIVLDARPKIQYLPQEPNDRDFAELMNQVCDNDWTRLNWLEVITEIVYDAHFYGTGLSSMQYDPEMNFGLGGIVYKSEEPLYCYPGVDARDVNKFNRSFVIAEPMEVNLIKERYPKLANYIRPDLTDLIQDKKTAFQSMRYRSPTDTGALYDSTPSESVLERDQALLITVYSHCNEYDEKSETDPQGVEQFTQYKKYPQGRKTVICNNMLCEDGENNYEDGLFPYQRYLNYVDPRSFWGISEVEQLDGPQKIFNKIFSFALDVMTLMGNPIWITDTTSGVDTANLINRPGLVVEKEPGSEVRREEGVQLQPYVMQIAGQLKEWFDQIAGSQDVSRGATPNGITAAAAISSLQEAAQTRIRQKSRNLDMYLQNLGQQYMSRVMQFYDVPRVVRITGNQNADKYFKMHIENRPTPEGDTQKVAVVQNYSQQPDGSYAEQDPIEYHLRGQLDVKVSTGSTLPFARAEKDAKDLQLFDRGIIDAEEVLKNADYPNYQAVLQRINDAKAQAAQAQAQQGGKPAAPQG